MVAENATPLPLDLLRDAFDPDEVQFLTGEEGVYFSIVSEETRVDVRFRAGTPALPLPKDLITGSEKSHKLLKKAKSTYALSFSPIKPQPSVAVFEALWCARSIMEQVNSVLLDLTAYKLHDADDVVEITELDFDVRDHVNLHAVEATEGPTPLWVHSHGLEKFGVRDVEAFHLGEDDLLAAETFLRELCTDLAFGHGPPLRAPVETSEGESFLLLPSEEGRLNLMGVPLDSFEGHEGLFYTVVAAGGRHTVAELLKPYRERFNRESPEEREALRAQAAEWLPAFKARFGRRGLMEPLAFLVRAPFESHPGKETTQEDLWLEVVSWEDGTLIGKLVDGGSFTTEWRKGAHVELDEGNVNALAVARDGRTLDEDETGELLEAERPM
ncbi:MAG TPA: hypothetical protein VEY30_07550 [Myxococcaceae bacterium]|nr:hypothetical protein [Myxococcaceae bacterium]